MTAAGGKAQRRSAVVAFRIHFRARRKQRCDNRGMTAVGGPVQRRLAAAGCQTHIRPRRKQRRGNGDIAAVGGPVQRRHAGAACLIHIRPMFGDEVIDEIQVARFGGGAQAAGGVAVIRTRIQNLRRSAHRNRDASRKRRVVKLIQSLANFHTDAGRGGTRQIDDCRIRANRAPMPPRRNQRGGNLGMTAVDGKAQRRLVVVVFRIHLRVRRKQRDNNGGAAVSGGPVQRRLAVVVFRIHLRARRKQLGDSGDMTAAGGKAQRRSAVVAFRIHFRVRRKQRCDNRGMTAVGGPVQRRLAAAGRQTHIRPRRKQRRGNGDIAAVGGPVQRRDAGSGCPVHIRLGVPLMFGDEVIDRIQVARPDGVVQGERRGVARCRVDIVRPRLLGGNREQDGGQRKRRQGGVRSQADNRNGAQTA